MNRAVTAPGTALAEALAYARMLVESGCPASWAAIKRQLLDADYLTLPEAYEQAADLMEPALVSANHREGVQAFRERPPACFADLDRDRRRRFLMTVLDRNLASADREPGHNGRTARSS